MCLLFVVSDLGCGFVDVRVVKIYAQLYLVCLR